MGLALVARSRSASRACSSARRCRELVLPVGTRTQSETNEFVYAQRAAAGTPRGTEVVQDLFEIFKTTPPREAEATQDLFEICKTTPPHEAEATHDLFEIFRTTPRHEAGVVVGFNRTTQTRSPSRP